MAKVKPPSEFSFEPTDWLAWRARFSRYMSASKLVDEEEATKVDILVYTMGEKADNIMNTFTYGTGESAQKYECVLSKFEAYFLPKRNVIYERSIFHSRKQQSSETVEQYYSDLHILLKRCEYDDKFKDEMLRDRLVLGLRDPETQKKLYMEPNLTIHTAVSIARQYELVSNQMSNALSQTSLSEIASKKKAMPSKYEKRDSYVKRDNYEKRDSRGTCDKCGYNKHADESRCPAIGKTCGKCHGKDHFRAACRTKNIHEIDTQEEQGGASNHNPASESAYFFGVVNCEDDKEAWTVRLKIRGNAINFKIDSGADMTAISKTVYDDMNNPPPLRPADCPLTSVGGDLMCHGMFHAVSTYKGILYKFKVAVVSGTGCLLGRAVANSMGLIKRMDSVNAVTPMNTPEVNISLREDAKPHCESTPRKIPFPLIKPTQDEIKKMERDDIIERVTEPTDWCAGMLPVVKKNGKDIRICVDLRHLNKSVRREHYPLPTLDDIAPKLAGSTVFSSLDAASGFWQVPLKKTSRELTTFITPFGRYMFKRLPFGISSGSEIFQRKMSELFEDEEGIEVIIDDILVHGKDTPEHDRRLKRALEILEKANVILNMDKCRFRQSELVYYGHIVGAHGVKPNPEKVEAITQMKAPSNTSELKSLMGLVNYLGKFVPNLSVIMKPVTDLLKKEMEWVWEAPQQKAFDEVKRLLSEAPTLAYYKTDRHTIVSADASSYGLGAVLLQEVDGELKPIAYASRTLTSAEQRYAQIEKECLASVWACDKFSRYLVGLPKFTLETDHKPLVPLLSSKSLADAPVRCQRLLVRMMRYNPEVIYVPGKQLVVADTLSRKPLSSECDDTELIDEIKAHIDAVSSSWSMSDAKLEQIRIATQNDRELSTVAGYVATGWPRSLKMIANNLLPYYQVASELSLVDGIIVKGQCIVIPPSLRSDILERLHESHQGLTRTRERCKDTVWWPTLSQDLKCISETCTICKSLRRTLEHEPLKPSEPAPRPWSRVATDLAHYKGRDYLILVDAYSRWIEIKGLTSTTTMSVKRKLMEIFMVHGYPDMLSSDNGPQFTSAEFHAFTDQCGIQHTTSSPHYHQGNGLAERAVQTAKRILALKNPEQGLLDYRATPCTVTGVSPAQALMGRQLRTRIPTLSSQLLPKSIDPEYLRTKDRLYKQSSKMYYDRRHGARAHKPLLPGTAVLTKVDEEKGWRRPGVIQDTCLSSRAYLIGTPEGRSLVRNRRHILNNEPAQPSEPALPNELALPDVPAHPSDAPLPATILPDTPVTPVAERPKRTSVMPKRFGDYEVYRQ